MTSRETNDRKRSIVLDVNRVRGGKGDTPSKKYPSVSKGLYRVDSTLTSF